MVCAADVGRPKSENPKTRAIQIRLTPADQAVFDRLLALYSEDAHGVEIKAPALIRALIMKEAAARGVEQPSSAVPPGKVASTNKPAPPGPRPRSKRPKL